MTSGDDVLSDKDGEVSKVTRRLGIHVGEGDEVKKKKKREEREQCREAEK